MTGFNKRVYEMLVRVQVFAKGYPHFFERNALAGQAISELDAAVQRLSAHATSLEGGGAKLRASSIDRVTARRILREWLETISRTAKGLRRAEFSMPRGRSDVTLVSVGRLWTEHVVPLKQPFIDSGMPADFIEKLNAAIENVQRTIQNQTQSHSARLEAAIAIQHTRGQAVAALRRLAGNVTVDR